MFSVPTRTWFNETFDSPTEVQQKGWKVIETGSHVLLVAPTGSGKTLAAFLAAIDRTALLPPDSEPGIRVVYVSPLKALVYDIERNLREPLEGIESISRRLEVGSRSVGVDVRTGDTPTRERNRQAKAPSEILVTTPESLFLLLGSRARENMDTVHTVIIDEVHALAPTKRGVHLAVSLERLSALAKNDPQRIGLSATVRPFDEVARFLGGNRPVEIVDASAPPHVDLKVTVPVPDMDTVRTYQSPGDQNDTTAGEWDIHQQNSSQTQYGIWSALYPKLLEEVQNNRSTLIFVNSRGLCERLAQRINDLAGKELVLAHHGSVSHEKRSEIEEGLKAGRIRGIVATSSLELGIDMGAIDRVILVESPGSVSRGLQRVGRAGHRVGEISVGRIYPKFKGDLLECAVIADRIEQGEIETTYVPTNVLDVLAQHVVAMCVNRSHTVDEIEGLVKRASPYSGLSRQALDAVLDMLSGTYPSSALAEIRPLLSWNRSENILTARRGAAMISRLNVGTIPDRGNYSVHLKSNGTRIGELDEEMVFETRAGENIILGATTWHVEEITRDRVVVSPAPGEPGKPPFWKGEGPGRPIELGRALGKFTRRLGGISRDARVPWLMEHTRLDEFAAENLANHIDDQLAHTGALPTDKTIIVERFRDELGDWRVCILSPFGARIHGPWAITLQRLLSIQTGFDVQIMYTDDGIVMRFAGTEDESPIETLFPDPEAIENLITEQVASTSLFAGLFRENAARALLLPRQGPRQRRPLWAQRLKAQNLLAAVNDFPKFPIVLETYRQALSDIFDLDNFRNLLKDIHSRKVRVHDVETRSASPFARSLVFAYVAEYIYEQDAPLAERKAQALTLDRHMLTELLGQVELRDLIDLHVLREFEEQLQHLTDEHRARDTDEVHDLLRLLGDLTEDEIVERARTDPGKWLARLEKEHRAVCIDLMGDRRWIAAEDAALYRDVIGAMPPPGLPGTFLRSIEHPLERLLQRYARSHGPFVIHDLTKRYGLRPSQLEHALHALERDGTLFHGEIRPGGTQPEWCHVNVLHRLKQRTLAKYRNQAAPVDEADFCMFLPQWHGIRSGRTGMEHLLEVIQQLEDVPISWMMLSQVILPQRIADFHPDMLNALSTSGRIVWVGRSSLGINDGCIALYRREQASILVQPDNDYTPPGQLHSLILTHLRQHGASFLFEMEESVFQSQKDCTKREFKEALWDLVWSGLITNDTFTPLLEMGRDDSLKHRKWRHSVRVSPGGRWSLVDNLTDQKITDTQRVLTRTHVLLERYGIVSREVSRAESLPGGFGPVYKALQAMEQAGKVRRGYFTEGLSGAQFGYIGAIERLRGNEAHKGNEEIREKDVLVLAAVDPANPYGALFPWPQPQQSESPSPRRIPHAWLIMVKGKPILYVGPTGRQLITFSSQQYEEQRHLKAAFAALRHLPKGRLRGDLVVETVDGIPVSDSPYYDLMLCCGFKNDFKGVALCSSP